MCGGGFGGNGTCREKSNIKMAKELFDKTRDREEKVKKKDSKAVRLLKYLIPTAVVLAVISVVMSLTGIGVAAKVNGKSISLNDYNRRVEAQQKYQSEYKKDDFTTDEGRKKLSDLKKQVMDQMIEEKVIQEEAAKLDISVNSGEVDKEYENMAKANGGEEKLKEVYSKYYGYTKEQFKKYSIEPKVLKQKVQEKIIDSDEVDSAANQKAEDLLKKIKSGEQFNEIAMKNSEDVGSASKGGDLGWIEKGKMVAEFEKAAFALGVGEVSSVVKTTYGYHLIKKLEADKDNKYHAAHILIKTKVFSEWVSEKVKAAKVTIYVKY